MGAQIPNLRDILNSLRIKQMIDWGGQHPEEASSEISCSVKAA